LAEITVKDRHCTRQVYAQYLASSRLKDPSDPAAMCLLSAVVGPNRAPEWAYSEAFRTVLLN
jgi:hypothetical protein